VLADWDRRQYDQSRFRCVDLLHQLRRRAPAKSVLHLIRCPSQAKLTGELLRKIGVINPRNWTYQVRRQRPNRNERQRRHATRLFDQRNELIPDKRARTSVLPARTTSKHPGGNPQTGSETKTATPMTSYDAMVATASRSHASRQTASPLRLGHPHTKFKPRSK